MKLAQYYSQGTKGCEHVDHKFDDFVSEFVWIRTGVGPTKDFYVRDSAGDKRYIETDKDGGKSAVVWFHDRHSHCADENINEDCYSIRIDGVFTDYWRSYLCKVGVFAQQSSSGESCGGFREILRAQGFTPSLCDSESTSCELISKPSDYNKHDIYRSPNLSRSAILTSSKDLAAARAVCTRTIETY